MDYEVEKLLPRPKKVAETEPEDDEDEEMVSGRGSEDGED
jgi:hypothetical protein